jgi:hypothetical protein
LKLILTVVVLALGGLIAACGSASNSSNTTPNSATAAAAAGGAPNASRRAALAACLKQHGVTPPARPPRGRGSTGTTTNGTGTPPRGGFFGGGGFANDPKLRAAFQACAAKLGLRGGRQGFRARLSRAVIMKYVTCVREHGFDLPAPNFSGRGPVFPRAIRGKAKFRAASRACQNLLAPPRPRGGTSTTSGA